MVSSSAVHAAALAAGIGFLLVAGFQFALALGAPWGRAAWGGANEGRLPGKLRVASAAAAAVWVFLASLILERAGHELIPLPFTVPDWVPWALFELSLLGAVMNLASRSRLERLIWSPVSGLLAVLCLAVAYGGLRT